MPTVLINCDGGLGNRFGSIIGGLRAAWALHFDPLIRWLPNSNCNAELGDLFERIPGAMHTGEIDPSLPMVTHRPWKERKCYALAEWPAMTRSFIYNSNRWTGCGRDVLQAFSIKSTIRDQVETFVAQHGIDKSWIGVHVRGTDNKHQNAIDIAWRLVRAHKGKVFLCSDDESIETLFRGHAVMFPKSEYVTKLFPDEPWRMIPKDNVAHHCYNVHRSKEATVQGFMDALILSRTTFQCGGSTFCRLAQSL